MAAGITAFQGDLGGRATAGYVIHGGDVRLPLAEGVTAVPFGDL